MDKKDKKRTLQDSINVSGWGFITIPVVLIGIFVLVPMIHSFILSFQTGTGISTEFGGLANYKRLLADPLFRKSLKNTILYLVIQVPIMIILALVFSTVLNNKNIKFRGLFRIAIFLPSVTSLVAYSVLFKSMFALDGVINQFLIAISIISKPIPWLLDPFWAKVTIIIAITWRWTGYNMIFYLAGLQNIDPSVYEAAELDGASSIDKFFRITVPMLRPIILLTTIMSAIGTLQLFDEVVNITNGGPGNATATISQYIYNLSFKFTPNFGYAATVSYAIVVIVSILTYIQFKVAGDSN